MENLEMIISGAGMGMTVVKSLLLLLLRPEDLFEDENVKIQIDNYMKANNAVKNVEEVRKFVTLVHNDKFTNETLSKRENEHLLRSLKALQTNILDFYFSMIKQIEDPEILKVCDIQTKLDSSFLQLVRLRLVIQPEVQISSNIHPVSKIPYLAVKSFWIDDNGTKKREFTRSLGPLEDYGFKKYDAEKVKADPKVKEESLKRIQEAIYGRYKEFYPE